jgi:hypothetical protein
MADPTIAPAPTAFPAVRSGVATQPTARFAGSRAALWWCMLAAMLAVLLAPVLAVPVPPLTDYPNHLARGVILAGPDDPVLRRMFAVRWELIPNLGVDLLLPPLLHVLPPLLAGRLVVALTVLLPTTGSIALGRACFGRRSLWQLAAGCVAYNAMFLIGLLNFQLSVGVALWGAAAWIVLSRRHPAAAVFVGALFALLAFVCHLFGFASFALLIGSFELAEMVRRGIGSPALRRVALGRVAAVAAAALVPLALYAASPLAATSGPVVWQTPKLKLLLLLVPVLGYARAASLAVAGGLCAALALWISRGRLRVAPLAWVAMPALLLAYATLPLGAKGGYWIDSRVPVVLGFLLFATTIPTGIGRRGGVLTVIALAALFAGRTAYITEVWLRADRDIADVRTVLAPVTPGSRVLMVDGGAAATPPGRLVLPGLPAMWWHDAAFALLDHRAWWADTFTLPGQQPVVALPPYAAAGDGGASPPPALTALDRAADPASYLADWRRTFDYVLELNTADAPPPPGLMPLERRGFATLYRVRR